MIFDFEIQILALFDSWLLIQNSKFNNFLRVCWFLGKIFLILYPPFENFTTHIAITGCYDEKWEYLKFCHPWMLDKSRLKNENRFPILTSFKNILHFQWNLLSKSIWNSFIKFVFSKKATKIDKIFNVNLMFSR